MDSAHLGEANAATVTGWVRVSGLPDTDKFYGIVGEETSTTDVSGNVTQTGGASFAVNHEGRLAFYDGTNRHLSSNLPIRPNAWNHATVVFTGGLDVGQIDITEGEETPQGLSRTYNIQKNTVKIIITITL